MALTDKNLYAYCDNNPVMRVDEDGEFWNILIGAGVGALVGAAVSIFSQLLDEEAPAINSGEFWAHVGVAALGGAVSGGLAASGVLVPWQIIVNAAIGGTSSILNESIKDAFRDDYSSSAETYFMSAVDGTLMGVVSGIIGGHGSASKHVSNSFWRMVSSGGRNMSYYFSQINRQAARDGFKAISSIIKATIPSVIDSLVNFLNQPVR